MDSKAWAKQNKKKFVAEFLSGSWTKAEGDERPMGIFMAGLPGSGKTELSRAIIKGIREKVLRIDMDEIASKIPGYTPERADEFREGASILLSEIFSKAIRSRMWFIMDGTFSGGQAIKNLQASMQRDYILGLIYIHQDPKMAWEFTLAREKVEHRAINFDGFLNSYGKMRSNLMSLNGATEMFFLVVEKDKSNHPSKFLPSMGHEKFDHLLKTKYNLDKEMKELEDGFSKNQN
ncbi:MAG: zeta toxin family protein [Candidatus Saccharibacteria bacterium]|nr:zeta toxin family protein [Candidatus Saccharibacteria bacterium]